MNKAISSKVGAVKEDLIAELLSKAYKKCMEFSVSRTYYYTYSDTFDKLFCMGIYNKEELDDKLPEDEVYVIYNKYTLLDKPHGKPRGDRYYVPREGTAIIVRSKNKPFDIMVYRQGRKWSVWEITNYRRTTFMPIIKLRNYIHNLVNSGFPRKYLVVDFPENLREAIDRSKSSEWNIKEAENEIIKNGITLVYWHKYNALPELEKQIELEGWNKE